MKMDRKTKNLIGFILVALLSFGFSIILSMMSFMKSFEESLINERFRWKPHKQGSVEVSEAAVLKEPVKSDLIIIGIDENSVSNDEVVGLGPWPWKRSVHARFLNYFRYDNKKYNPHLIFFDIFFDYIRDINDDRLFFNELKNHNNVVFDYMSQPGTVDRFPVKDLYERLPFLLKSKLNPVNPEEYKGTLSQDIKAPVKEIASAAAGIGSAFVEGDLDGTIRRMPLVFAYYDERLTKEPYQLLKPDTPVFLPTIDMVIIMEYFQVKPENVEVIFGKHILMKQARIPIKNKNQDGGMDILDYKIENIQIPIDYQGKMYINYQGVSHSYDYYSYGEIKADFQDNNNNAIFKNKVLLVGFYSSAGLGETKDYHMTPYGPMYGIEIHANALYTIINRQFIKTVPTIYQYIFMVLLIIIVSFILSRINIIKGLIFGFIILVFIFFFGVWLFAYTHYLGGMTQPLSAVLVAMILTISYKVMTEEKDKRFLKATFSQYISPELIDIMYESQTMPQLGGSSDILTAFFTDIEKFSTFSEKLTATQLVELLNEYLSEQTDILLSEKGTLDKYEGDAIIAFFGAPMKLPDNAVRACRTAIRMQEKLAELREKWKNEKTTENRNTKNLPESEWAPGEKWPKVVHNMRMRIGINTGEIVTGNMGSRMRMNYTMMGDAVNLAARLESGAKQYGVYTMISEFTYNYEFIDENGQKRRVSDFFEVRFLDKITVVGKSLPVAVYELINLKGKLTENEEILLPLYNEAMELYLAMEWDQAKAKFEEALPYERFPHAKINPCLVFIERCEQYKKNPPVKPGEKWDGVYRLESK